MKEWQLDLKKRFVDNGDGTVTDLETKLMWKQTDSFQDTSQWTNWFKAFEYIRSLELQKFAGYSEKASIFSAAPGALGPLMILAENEKTDLSQVATSHLIRLIIIKEHISCMVHSINFIVY